MGVKLAAEAGYDPRALERCLDRLTKTVELFLGEKEKHSYFSDHPATADRMEAIEKTASGAQRASIPPILPSREAFLRLLDGLAAEEKGKGQIVVGLVEGADPSKPRLEPSA